MYGMLGLFFREFEGLVFFTFYLKDGFFIYYKILSISKYKSS